MNIWKESFQCKFILSLLLLLFNLQIERKNEKKNESFFKSFFNYLFFRFVVCVCNRNVIDFVLCVCVYVCIWFMLSNYFNIFIFFFCSKKKLQQQFFFHPSHLHFIFFSHILEPLPVGSIHFIIFVLKFLSINCNNIFFCSLCCANP